VTLVSTCLKAGAMQISKSARTGVMMTVDTMSWFFRVDSISSTARAGRKSVASSVVNRQTRMPDAVISSGYDIAVHEWLWPSDDTDDTCHSQRKAITTKEVTEQWLVSGTDSLLLAAKLQQWRHVGMAHHERGAGGLSKGAEQIRAHAGDVTNIVTDIVCRWRHSGKINTTALIAAGY
jgi:hypothetical protein